MTLKGSSMVTYKDSGVNIEAGYEVVEMLKRIARPSKNVLRSFGGLGGLFSLALKGYKKPVLVSCADGVGTKLKVAMAAGVHDTVGIDLVAMSANDLIRCGAKPLFFVDYIACHKNEKELMSALLRGIIAGCKLAECDLLGGETAELGDMYKLGEYDLAGFCVGVVDKNKLVDGSRIKPGDVIVGLASSGLHSNGYTLARRVLLGLAKIRLTDYLQDTGRTLGEELLEPTRIYVSSILALIKKVKVKGIAHITGGGFGEKLGRILPNKVQAVVDSSTWEPNPIFSVISKFGKVEKDEMFRTFNMGIGMVVVVDKKDVNRTLNSLKSSGEEVLVIGEIVKGRGTVSVV
jgi:phosphoribosylformylglycinamidine cyclo-ligase